jgi:hypothetical protein
VTRRDQYLRRTYNLTEAEYEKMLDHQGGRCYICQKPPKNVRLAVDHDHFTGQVRGLLCWQCNSLLAKARDDDLVLGRASIYLVSPPAVAALGRAVYGKVGSIKKKRRVRRKTT